MLQHMSRINMLYRIPHRVNVRIPILKRCLKYKRRRKPVARGAPMVGARIPALALHVRNVSVFVDHAGKVLVQRRGGEVGDQAEGLGLTGVQGGFGVSDHVLLKHGPDVAASCCILCEDVLGAAQTAFFGCVPVELDGVFEFLGGEICVGEKDAESFEDHERPATVVVDARGAAACAVGRVDGVEVATDDDGAVGAAGDFDDDGLLGEGGVRERFGGDTVDSGCLHNTSNLGEEPFGGLGAGFGLTEARVIGGVVLEVFLDVVPVELWNETLDVLLVLEFRGVWCLFLDFANFGVEVCDIEKVASAAAILLCCQC